MSEQEATDKLEEIVGSVDKCFRLMRLYVSCAQKHCDTVWPRKARNVDEVFREAALRDGYSGEAITHYLNHVR